MSVANRTLYNQAPVKDPLLWSDVGGRIKKGIEYVRHYQPDIRSVLEAADLILITDQAGHSEYYMVDPTRKPIYMPQRKKFIGSKWGTALAKLVGGSNPSNNRIDIEEMDVGLSEIGFWKIYVGTPGVMIDIEQPSNTPVFTTGTDPVRVTYGNSAVRAIRGMWGSVPELMTFEEKTPVTVNAFSTNMNEDLLSAYVAFEGYRYRLMKVEVPMPAEEPRTVMTLQIGAIV